MSSLATQLAQSASLNAGLLVDRSKRKPTESYLFTGKDVDAYDLESIHALGLNGLLQLAKLDPSIKKFQENLFGESAKGLDRTLLSQDEAQALDIKLEQLLRLMGRWIMESPTGCVIEWLVRRFRIHEFNIPTVLAVFLPYHESVHFAKMLSILHIKPQTAWGFLLPFKSAAQNLPRIPLVTGMLQNTDVARFVVSLLPDAVKAYQRGGPTPHSALLAFNAACAHDFITRSTKMDEGTAAFLMPAFLLPLTVKNRIQDAMLGSIILLAILSRKCTLSSSALNIIIQAMAEACEVVEQTGTQYISTSQFLKAALSTLEGQEELNTFEERTSQAIIRLKNLEQALTETYSWNGAEKLLRPLLPSLIDSAETTVFEPLLTSLKVPEAVIERAATLLIERVLKQTDDVSPCSLASRNSLSIIYQRHHPVFTKVCDLLCSGESAVDSNALDQLRISLSMVPTVKGPSRSSMLAEDSEIDTVLASTNPDTRVRVVAVTRLLETLQDSQTLDEDKESAQSALLARAQDTNVAVIEALYSIPEIILPVLLAQPFTYINHLTEALCSRGTSIKKNRRPILRAHFQFLVTYFLPNRSLQQSIRNAVFYKVIFPFLLFTKPRQHTAEAVWTIIMSSPQDNALHEWLTGCSKAIKKDGDQVQVGDTDKMAEMNFNIASSIARNILKSNQYLDYFNDLVSKLEDSDSSVRVLAHLIGRSLLLQLSGEHQVEAARQMLKTLSLSDLAVLGDLERNDSVEIIAEAALGKLVVNKPSSQSTSCWLQVSLIAVALNIPRPENARLNWFEQSMDAVPATRGLGYIELLRTVYRIANLLSSAPSLIVSILSTLFETLKTDVLAFLAAIWTTPPTSSPSEITDMRTIALHHGAAFLHAHVLEEDDTDFQTILPSLLVPLQSPDGEQRRIAMTCISHLHQLASRKFKRVYGFDTIYGSKTAQLQYLDQQDLGKYISQLVEHQEHFLQDRTYLAVLHQQRLHINKTQKKRDNEYRQRVLCFLSSHVAAFATPFAQTAILHSLEFVSDGAKTLSLAPLITCTFSQPAFNLYMQEPPKQALLVALAASFDISVAQDLNDDAQTLWPVFLSVLCRSLTVPALFNVTGRLLKAGLFAALNADRRVLILNTILDSGMEDAENYTACKQLLGWLLEDVSTICHMVELNQPDVIGESPRSAKRAKTTGPSKDNSLLRLTLLAEVLASKPLPGSLDLVSQLLDAMNAILHSSTTQADSDYVEQLLMAAIEESSRNITEIPNLSPSNVRLDVLVELLRVAENPQTFHQALLLIADLTRLAPDSVLCNVMPIFTFMGSNVFHRDDTYSFKVVQQASDSNSLGPRAFLTLVQTIDNIVPVMVSSLRQSNSPGLELFRASKPFIRTFSDASHHIPRHRRLGFFSHLLDVLGVDFLPALCMLLLERVANRIVRQANEDVVSLIQLPQSLMDNQAYGVQIQALTDILCEARRLIDRLTNPEAGPLALLDTIDDDPDAILVGAWRRAKTLLIFVGYATKSFTTSSAAGETSQLVSSLISLTQRPVSGASQDKLDDLALTAQNTLHRVLESLRASDFISAALSALRSENSQVSTNGLALLSDRLPKISAATRQGLSSTMVEIITTIQGLVTNRPTPELMSSAFGALHAIATTLSTGEGSAMAGTIQIVLKAMKRSECIAPALKLLTPLPSRLGPRIIPYYREIVDQCIILIRAGESDLVDDACATIRSLLVSIPTFWGSTEVIKTISLVVNSPENRNKNLNNQLTKAVVKNIPTTVVIPALLQIWEEPWLNTSQQRIFYMEILQKALRNASRPVVLGQLKPTFKVLLSSFDFASEEKCPAETQTISAFRELVVKLNEAAFRSLFRRLYDWAFANDISTMRKKVVFCHLYSSLLEYFKGLMTPYMTIVLDSFLLALETLDYDIPGYEEFWLGILQALTRSLTFDESTFWRDDKLRRLSGPLIQQVAVCARLKSFEAKSSLQGCLNAVVEATSDDAILKNMNLQLLMHTRSEEARIRQTALICAESLWRNQGNKLLGLVAETTTFIAECSEDENDMVVKESFRLKDAVEKAAGSIDGLLDR